MKYSEKIEGKIATRMARKKSAVLLRDDFTDLGGYDQVGRALQSLVKQGKLIKIGYGLYAKAKVSNLTGNVIPVQPLPFLAKAALDRLGIKTKPTKADMEYQEGRTTQVPTGRLIGVTKRITRKIGYKETAINYELSTR